MNADGPTASASAESRFAKLRELFDEARDLPIADRAAFLGRACAGDHGLLEEVRQLLEASDNVGDRFDPDRGGLAGAALNVGRSARHPERIGPYRIRREIGRGGMGVVYLAEQSNPQREVALKILNGGRHAGALQSRFAREVRVLGRLEHPGITRIYEAGTAETEAGPLSCFAMEYIRGPRLTDYAEQAKLPIAARVELVARIADAVQHAHTKGVIHRDLKPANILMDEEATGAWERSSADPASRSGVGGPQPKILDFGVARLLEPDTQRTAITEAGLLIGTVSYMSPEQLTGDTDAVDARADVYAMGVILYQLLTGRLPHDLRAKPIAEAARIVCSEELAPLNATGNTTAGSIDRDLETIVARAMATDRERRYATAAALADDLRRYLRHEPILARPATAAYQIVKFARRHRGLVAGAAAAMLMLIAGLAISTTLYIREQHARRLADEKDRLSEAVRGYMIDGLLLAAGPDRMGYDVKMVDVLTHATEGLHERFKEQPEVEGSIRADLANVLSQIGKMEESKAQWKLAIPLLERTAGPDALQTVMAVISLCTTLQQLHQGDEWLETAKDALARARRSLPEGHTQTIFAMSHVGGALATLRRYEEATPVLREALALAEQNPEANQESIGGLLTWLTACEEGQGHKEAALDMRRRVVQYVEKVYGPDHRNTLTVRMNLAMALTHNEQMDEAVEIVRPLPYATEPDIATELLAATRTMLGRGADQPSPQ